MKKSVFRLITALLTLISGLISVWFPALFPGFEQGQYIRLSDLHNDVPGVEMTLKSEIPVIHHFKPTFRACKPGYIQGYITDDGQKVAEGNNICNLGDSGKTKNEFNDLIAKAKKVIERRNQRAVLEYEDEKGRYYRILQYKGGDCIEYIHAPTLELLLEFEMWLKSHK